MCSCGRGPSEDGRQSAHGKKQGDRRELGAAMVAAVRGAFRPSLSRDECGEGAADGLGWLGEELG